jgi:hypothetical protein
LIEEPFRSRSLLRSDISTHPPRVGNGILLIKFARLYRWASE